MNNKSGEKGQKTIDRIFMFVRILLVVSPFVALAYLSFQGTSPGTFTKELIENDPKLAVSFLIAMIHPFIAYMLGFVKQHLQDGDYDYVVVNLAMIIISEVLLQNVFYIVILGYLLYKCIKTYRIQYLGAFRRLLKNHFLKNVSGSIVIIVFAIFCAFAMYRVNLIA